MKIAWFSPLSHRSAIARFSIAVAESLSREVEIELFYFDKDLIRETNVVTKWLESSASVTPELLSRYDMVVYNLGNNLPFHREIFEVSRRWPGVCILHDAVMHHFFVAYHLESAGGPSSYEHLMQTAYGITVSVADRIWETNNVVHFPLVEEAIRGALGVVTHSEFSASRIASEFGGPSLCTPLAYDAGVNSAMSRAELGVDSDQVLILTVGHLHPNKQIERVIDALAQARDSRIKPLYVIVGPIPAAYQVELTARARAMGVIEMMRFVGEVSDEVLNGYLSAADICINLRFPSFEGASASVIEEMLSGKPVIVNDNGAFSELPDNCVVKVPVGDAQALEAALRRLMTDPEARSQIGAQARTFATSEFRPSRYAERLMAFLSEVRSASPLLKLADRVSADLARMGLYRDSELVGVVAANIESTFGSCK